MFTNVRIDKTIIYLILGIILFLALGYFFLDIYIYFIVAMVISAILRPLSNSIARTQIYNVRLPRVVAVLATFVIFGGFLALIILLFIPFISAQVDVLTGINYESIFEKIQQPISRLEEFIIAKGLTTEPSGFVLNQVRAEFLAFIARLDFSSIFESVVSFSGNFFIGILAVSFISFFLLYEMGTMRKKLIAVIPNKYFEVTIAAFFQMEKLLSNYLLGLLFQMISVFAIASLGLSIVGVNFALTIALVAAIANLIPYLGPLIGAIFGIIVGVTTGIPNLASPNEYLLLIGGISTVFAIVQVTDNILLQPIIFSKSVKAHPLEIFIIIFAAASIGGIPGMVLAIPAYTILRVSSKELYNGYRQYRIFKN